MDKEQIKKIIKESYLKKMNEISNNMDFIKQTTFILINFCKNNDMSLENIDFPDNNLVKARICKDELKIDIIFNADTKQAETTLYKTEKVFKPVLVNKEEEKEEVKDIDIITNSVLGFDEDIKIEDLKKEEKEVELVDKKLKMTKIEDADINTVCNNVKKNCDVYASIGKQGTELYNNANKSILNLGTSTKNIENLNDENNLLQKLKEKNAPPVIMFAVQNGFPNRGLNWLKENS